MPKYSKKLDLRLPTNHPIFDYPPGARAQVAREWLDIGMRLERIENLLKQGAVVPAQASTPLINTKKLQKQIEDMF